MVQQHTPARRRGPSAVLEDRPLSRRAHGGLRETSVGPQRREERNAPVAVKDAAREAAEARLEAKVVVAEQKALPALGSERNVLEHHRAFDAKGTRGAAVEMLRRHGEHEVGRCLIRLCRDCDADLRRGELLDLDGALAKLAAVLAGRLDDNRPHAARLLRRHRELLVCDKAANVRHERDARIVGSLRIAQDGLHRERLRRPTRAVAQDDVHEDALVMAVDAALGPHERRAFASCEIFVARAVGVRLVDLHGVAQGHERHVVGIGGEDYYCERLAVSYARRHAPSAFVCPAVGNLDVGGGVDLDPRTGDGPPLHERSDPHADRVAGLAHAEPQVGNADQAVPVRVARLVIVVPPPHIVAPREVGTADCGKEHPASAPAVLHPDGKRQRLLFVQTVCAAEHVRLARPGQLRRVLVVDGRVPAAPRVHALVAREKLHDVAGLDAPQLRVDVGDVHRLDRDGARSAGRQVASARGELDVRIGVLAAERIGPVARKSARRGRVAPLVVERQALADEQYDVGSVRELTRHVQVRLELARLVVLARTV